MSLPGAVVVITPYTADVPVVPIGAAAPKKRAPAAKKAPKRKRKK